MVEKFYSSNLSAEMNIDLLQGLRDWPSNNGMVKGIEVMFNYGNGPFSWPVPTQSSYTKATRTRFCDCKI